MQKKHTFTAHPWHGIPVGEGAPDVVTVFVEIVPTDTVKFEVDKLTGHLKVDRPQKYSSQCPTLYGFVPQTYCGDRVGELCSREVNRQGIKGDGDPLDICVITERPILVGNIIVTARPIGGLRVIDRNEADDKIIAVLDGDGVFGQVADIEGLATSLVDRLRHYFLTYKEIPGAGAVRPVEVAAVYGRATALEVIRASCDDYRATFGNPE